MKYFNVVYLCLLILVSCTDNRMVLTDRDDWAYSEKAKMPENDPKVEVEEKDFCELNPTYFSCFNYCEEFPGSLECQAYCLGNPEDSICDNPINCSLNPKEPACQLYCEANRKDPNCDGVLIFGYGNVGDIFIQVEDFNMVDIIWIIDSSGSMKEEQTSLADNFEKFIGDFLKDDTDFRMGITTTDIALGGEFLGSIPVLSSEMSDSEIHSNFVNNIKVGISGSGSEKGLAAASLALEKNLDSSSVNFGFLREDAFLAIIIVSDENDISPNSTESYVNRLITAKGGLDKVAVYSIVDTTTLSYPDPYTEPIDLNLYSSKLINPGGARYMKVSEVTGGFSQDIHESFATSLLEIGEVIRELIHRYPLANIPLVTSLKLKINGENIPYDDLNGWVYDSFTNSILFRGSFIPPKNAVVEITYQHLLQ